MLIEALFTGVLSAAAPQLPAADHSAPIVLCDDEAHGKGEGKKDEQSGKKKENDKKGDSKPEEPKPSSV